MELNKLEREVLKWFEHHSGNSALSIQCKNAFVVSREYTGVGLVTRISTPNTLPAAEIGCAPNAPLLSSALLPHGAGVDLWLDGGYITELEFISFGSTQLPNGDFPFELKISI